MEALQRHVFAKRSVKMLPVAKELRDRGGTPRRIPLHRLERALGRAGISIARSTLVDFFHRAAEELEPLYRLLIEEIASNDVVHAGETTQRVQAPKKTRTSYLWTFLSLLDDPLIGFVFSPSRSGKTPEKVLGGTQGALIVDAYSGYNQVTTPEGRIRVSCLAHVRRKFFDASFHQEEARFALDQILELYRVEAEARAAGILRTAAHGVLRQEQSNPVVENLHAWLIEQEPVHPPKSPLGVAIRYALKQWEALTRFLDDPRLPLDNNPAENALRVAALGRKNFLFVGNDAAGENLAALYSPVGTCEANGIIPEEDLADVLIRVRPTSTRGSATSFRPMRSGCAKPTDLEHPRDPRPAGRSPCQSRRPPPIGYEKTSMTKATFTKPFQVGT